MKKQYFYELYFEKYIKSSILLRNEIDSIFLMPFFFKVIFSFSVNKLLFLEDLNIIKGFLFIEFITKKRPKLKKIMNYFYNGVRLYKFSTKVIIWFKKFFIIWNYFLIYYFKFMKKKEIEFFLLKKLRNCVNNSISVVLRNLNMIPFFSEDFFDWPYQIMMTCVVKNFKNFNSCLSLLIYLKFY